MADSNPASGSADLTGRRWLFGPAVLDERSLQLEVDGQHVPLERKPLEVLLYLLHHAGEVVTQDDLAESLWPGRILTDSVLTRCISVLRQALKDEGKTLIRTVHGYGYRLVADVRVELSSSAVAPPALDFKAGDHPPLRPQWKLVERLGTGAHGEAWLARHEKTGDARVFKFAVDAGALTALKREITLYRLLHDSLGARAAIARIYEWNLSEPPYFIEMEHVAGGNLQAWSDAQGGLANIPLATRLELAAQIADALAAAHSVGALHKDLKPGNVLVAIDKGAPTVRLCDFGSGGVLDHKRLEELGITRLGFTQTLTDGNGGGTALYLAPEVVSGQLFTMQSDIYALGVLLYQLVTGEIRKALAPGWENDVADELLREDIAIAAAGNPTRRLTDAGKLAERLRTLDARRQARAAEEAARQRAERARRTLSELKRTRVYAVLLLGLTVLAAAGSVAAYRARNAAIAATATAQAISGFLMEDVFRMDKGLLRPSESSYEALLHRAADHAGTRLKDQPEAAASIYWSLGRRYQEIGAFQIATTQYEKALNLFKALYGESEDQTLMALDRLAWTYIENGQIAEGLAALGRLRQISEKHFGDDELATLAVQARVSRTLAFAGKYAEAEKELRTVIAKARPDLASSDIAASLLEQWFGIRKTSDVSASLLLSAYAQSALGGSILEEFGDGYAEAEALVRASIAILSSAPNAADLLAVAHMYLVGITAARGDYVTAENSAQHVRAHFDRKFPHEHYARGLASMTAGLVRLEQRRHPDAVRLFQEAVAFCAPRSGCPPRVRAALLWNLGRAHKESGHSQAAIESLREALSVQRRLYGGSHPITVRAKVDLADAMLASGDVRQAAQALTAIGDATIAGLHPNRQVRGDLLRVEGLLLLKQTDFDGAIAKFRGALKVVTHRLGDAHWRTEAARRDLQLAVQAKTKVGRPSVRDRTEHGPEPPAQ